MVSQHSELLEVEHDTAISCMTGDVLEKSTAVGD